MRTKPMKRLMTTGWNIMSERNYLEATIKI